MENAIEVMNLSKSYADFSLHDVTFSVPKGSIMGFIGENGAGKSTTIKAILNIALRNSGDVKFFGMDLNEHEKEIKERIGVVFDENCFHETLTPKDISRIMENIYQRWDSSVYQRYLEKFGLSETKKIKEFSRGMKMKLGITVALSHAPEILILDEATAGLDPVVREEILDILLEFIQDEEHAVLISSHITSDLDKVADYITFIHKGTIEFSKPRDELLDDMAVVKCSIEEFSTLDKKFILRHRQNQFGCEVLIKNRRTFLMQNPEMVIDPITIESIMLFYSRGQMA